MARLFVVNCTGRHKVVNFRLDYTVDDQGRRTSEKLVPYKTMTIPPRQQVPFGGDLFPSQVQEIISQLEQNCKAVNSSEIRTAKAKGVVDMLWQLDKPIPLPVLKDVFSHNVGRLSDQGAARRRRLAIDADRALTTLMDSAPRVMEMEYEQVEQDEDFSNLQEGLRIKHADNTAPKTRSTRKKAA